MLHTRMQAPFWLFRQTIADEDFNRVLGTSPQRSRRVTQKALGRALWFWPRIEDAKGWAVATTGSAWNPEQYLHTHRTQLVDKILEYVPRDASLMELGCNCGSDMAQLFTEGYRDLRGVDAGRDAISLFAEEYPDTFACADIRHDLFQRYLMHSETDEVDYVYSNGATIELVHPSFPIVAEMCRVARCGVLLDLSERNQGYPRDYVGQFAKHGFALAYTNRDTQPTEKSHIFVFLHGDAAR
jgi:SAM-dependent methyltransferase